MSAARPEHRVAGQPARNLGEYRTEVICTCGAKIYYGDHERMPSLAEAMTAHRFNTEIQSEQGELMSEYPDIRADEVRPGDKVRHERHAGGIGTVEIYTVATIGDEGDSVLFGVIGGAQRLLLKELSLILVDRPAPKLPTKPGSIILAYEVLGKRIESGWPMIADEDGEWTGVVPVSGRYWHESEDITDWSPATVTKATSTIEKDSL